MNSPEALLKRLEEIGASLAASEHALALIGLGSAGPEVSRLDSFSDLDFFAIVADGKTGQFIDNLGWLMDVNPIAYAFRNTVDGYKLLFEDGIFCEFAVFDRAGLEGAAFSPGRVIWKRAELPEAIAIPRRPLPERHLPDVAWQIGEALTNLYVGLLRYRRGEILSAHRFVQVYAVDRVVAIAPTLGRPAPEVDFDPFTNERRFEQRFPALAVPMPAFMQGYDRTPQSAAAILTFLEQHCDVNPSMAKAIRSLLQE
jgi:hypothetical protein